MTVSGTVNVPERLITINVLVEESKDFESAQSSNNDNELNNNELNMLAAGPRGVSPASGVSHEESFLGNLISMTLFR